MAEKHLDPPRPCMFALSFLMNPWTNGEKRMIIINCRYSMSMSEYEKKN